MDLDGLLNLFQDLLTLLEVTKHQYVVYMDSQHHLQSYVRAQSWFGLQALQGCVLHVVQSGKQNAFAKAVVINDIRTRRASQSTSLLPEVWSVLLVR